MALISCPECTKDISDRVISCPHCGYPLVESEERVNRVDLSSVSLRVDKHRKRKILLGLGAIVLLLLMVIGVNGALKYKEEQRILAEEEAFNIENAKNKENYIVSINELINDITTNASNGEDFLILLDKVWYNSIFKKSDEITDEYTKKDGVWNKDFNDSLQKVQVVKMMDTLEMKKKLEENSATIKSLSEYPEEYKEIHELLLDTHVSYESYIDFVRNPSGNLESFRTSRREKGDQLSKDIGRLKAMIPDISDAEEGL